MTVLVDRQTQATADLLATLKLRAGMAQKANLEDVRVVPTFLECRVREDERARVGAIENKFLVSDDLFVRPRL